MNRKRSRISERFSRWLVDSAIATKAAAAKADKTAVEPPPKKDGPGCLLTGFLVWIVLGLAWAIGTATSEVGQDGMRRRKSVDRILGGPTEAEKALPFKLRDIEEGCVALKLSGTDGAIRCSWPILKTVEDCFVLFEGTDSRIQCFDRAYSVIEEKCRVVSVDRKGYGKIRCK